MHAKVVRPYSHSHSDEERDYKSAEEREAEAAHDPITNLTQFLKSESLATDQELADIRREVDAEVADAAERALKAPKPPVDTAALWLYSPDVDPTSDAFASPPRPEASRRRWWRSSTGRCTTR